MHHHHTPEQDSSHSHHSEAYMAYLRQFDRIFEAQHRQMIDWLNIPHGSHILDAGCGAGGVTRLLAEAAGEPNSVVAVDIEPGLLETAQEVLRATAYQALFKEGSLDALPFEDGAFDLVWCSRVLHHMPDMLATALELRRVLKPGGRLALREDSVSLQLLPFDVGLGQPGLDERLNAVRAWNFARLRPSLPNFVPYPFGWTHLLREAGFANVAARSFILEALPPFGEDLSAYLLRHWGELLDEAEIRTQLSLEDQHVLEQLANPDSPHFLLKRDDLHFVKVSTVYVGHV